MGINEDYSALQKVMLDYSSWVISSAEKILPWIGIEGQSIVDFGCGRGDWLRVARQLGASDVLGLDTFALEGFAADIPVQYVNLTQDIALPRRYGIAMCLEVAEHLPPSAASTIVSSLVSAAPVVLFSAAIPGQGGIHHLNEQSPQYWFDLFQQHGYVCLDFRDAIWTDEDIEPWYRMNVLVFAHRDHLPEKLIAYQVEKARHIVHPDIFQAYAPLGKNIILHFDQTKKQWFPEFTD